MYPVLRHDLATMIALLFRHLVKFWSRNRLRPILWSDLHAGKQGSCSVIRCLSNLDFRIKVDQYWFHGADTLNDTYDEYF